MPTLLRRADVRPVFAWLALGVLVVSVSGVALAMQGRREFAVSARRYEFRVNGTSVSEIRVTQDDLVHVTFSAEDIAHSFTIEEAPYRIMRRAEPGKPVSFDFRADQAGRFRFYCNLTADEKCKDMQGTLIVEPKR